MNKVTLLRAELVELNVRAGIDLQNSIYYRFYSMLRNIDELVDSRVAMFAFRNIATQIDVWLPRVVVHLISNISRTLND